MNFQQFEEFLLSDKCYDEHDVSIIDTNGLQHYIEAAEYFEYQIKMTRYLAEQKVTVKIEQMENHWKFNDRTMHLFYNPKNGPTFSEHTDPINVIIECKDGIKHIEVEGWQIDLLPNERLYIPADTFHKALNYEKALVISHGISDTETLERLRKND